MDEYQGDHDSMDKAKPEYFEEFIVRLNQGNENFYTDQRGKGAIKNLSQTFPFPWIYIAELIQNAIDENARHLKFQVIENGRLIFEHDGKAFSERDVEGLCTRGVSTKSAKTIGFMGVGFKSVFKSYETVEISSEEWKFRLRVPIKTGLLQDVQRDWIGCVLPIYDSTILSPSMGMNCRFTMSNRLDGLGSIEDDFTNVLQADMSLLPLLALRGVEEFAFDDKQYQMSACEYRTSIPTCKRVIITAKDVKDDGAAPLKWLILSNTYQPSNDAVKRFVEHRELYIIDEEEDHDLVEEVFKPRNVQIFCRIDENNVPMLPDEGKAFAVLPTQQKVPIRINVQADWLLDISRKGFMESNNNLWHQEIFQQVPYLIKCFLEWLVSDEHPRKVNWYDGYNIIPRINIKNIKSEYYGNEFIDILSMVLRDVKFLPSVNDNGISFLSPAESIYLPVPLDKNLNNLESKPWLLFGNDIIDAKLIGQQALNAIKGLKLSEELSLVSLGQRLENDRVANWLASWTEPERRKRMVISLLASLNELKIQEDSNNVPLKCLPTEDWDWDSCCGTISSQIAIKRLPRDWQHLKNEPEIASAIKKASGDDKDILNSALYAHAFRRIEDPKENELFSRATNFMNLIKMTPLEELARKWLAATSNEYLNNEQIINIVKFTKWTRTTQLYRQNVITHVLVTKKDNTISLIPTSEALLADPYAGKHRRLMFPDHSIICDDYYKSDMADPNDWRAFFEGLQNRPKGAFSVFYKVSEIPEDSKNIKKWFGGNRSLRRTFIEKKWKNFKITNKCFYLLDGIIPEIDELRGDSIKSAAFVKWIEENPGILSQNRFKILGYIPAYNSDVWEKVLSEPMSWVQQLSDNAWIPANDEALYKPEDILTEYDKGRPHAPYAKLSTDLIKVLSEARIEFGSNVPKAAALTRLIYEAPTAKVERLVELLEKAIREVSDNPEDKQRLAIFLREQLTIPLPEGERTCDGMITIPFKRIVEHAGSGKSRRSDLMKWVVSRDHYHSRPQILQAIEITEDFLNCRLPLTTDYEQTLSFLKWVWATRPPADQVRTHLRSAYDYILQDIDTDAHEKMWAEAATEAHVFTSKKRWRPATTVYFDDIQRTSLLNNIESFEIATQGHLGSDPSTFLKVARLLKLKPLSERIRIEVKLGDEAPLPMHWARNFERIASAVESYMRTNTSDDEDEKSDQYMIPKTTIKRVKRIHRAIYDDEVLINEREDNCDYDKDNNIIYVQGEPFEFVSRLCEMIVDIWRLTARGLLVAKITALLLLIDNDSIFSKGLKELNVFCNIQEESEISNVGGVIAETVKKDEIAEELKGKESLIPKVKVEPPVVKKEVTQPKEEAAAEYKKRRASRIVTYVFPVDTIDHHDYPPGATREQKEKIDRIGNAAEEYVLQELAPNAQRMPKNNPGYDIEYCEEGKSIEYIEVKGIEGEWNETGVGLTARQYEEARLKKEAYWLYVVENVLSDNPTIHKFHNPAWMIGNYRLDHKWRDVEYMETASKEGNIKYDRGQKLRIKDKLGEIEEVVSFGKLGIGYRVRYNDGSGETIRDGSIIEIVE